MKKQINIALLGTNSDIFFIFLNLLKKYKISIKNLFLLDEKENIGNTIFFKRKRYKIIDVKLFNWSKVEIVILISTKITFHLYLNKIIKTGCFIIDGIDFFCFKKNIPIIIPEINSDVLNNFFKKKIVSVANSYVSQFLISITPIIDILNIDYITLTNLFPVSIYGKKVVKKLASQSAELLNGLNFSANSFYEKIGFNILPLFNNFFKKTDEEVKFINQVRRILKNFSLSISVNFLQAPVFYGTTQSIHIKINDFVRLEKIKKEIKKGKNINLVTEENCLIKSSKVLKNNVSIFFVEKKKEISNIINFCSVSDNISFCGARILIETLKLLIQMIY